MSSLQMRRTAPETRQPDAAKTPDAQATARQGASGSGSSLSNHDRIQKSFGRHDISGVKRHVDKESTGALGAEAYAFGQDVVVGEGGGDLFTEAHEAAHTIQQRGGVSLNGGVGQAGDAYERNADEVAAAVVAGKSAEALLDPFAGDGAAAAGGPKSVQKIDIPADIQQMSIQQCKDLATNVYVGGGDWNNRGILDHKIDAANDMRTDLNRVDPQSFSEKVALAALTVAVAAGAAALSVGTLGLGAALIAGGAAVVTALPAFFSGGDNIIDPTSFVSSYISGVRTGWPTAAGSLNSRMTTETSARSVAASARSLAENPEKVKSTERNSILDGYVTAMSQFRGGASAGGMGSLSYDDATEGRLHLDSLSIGGDFTATKPRFATLEGVGLEKVRNFNLDRKLGDIKCPRTMSVTSMYGVTALGLGPSDGARLETGGMSMSNGRAKMTLASFAVGRELDADDASILEGSHDQKLIDDNWSLGLTKCWDQVRGSTLRELGMSSVGN